LRFAEHTFQIGAHIGGILVAQLAVFVEGFIDDLFELRRNVGIEASGRSRRALDDRIR
jgi:hypothetical protein